MWRDQAEQNQSEVGNDMLPVSDYLHTPNIMGIELESRHL